MVAPDQSALLELVESMKAADGGELMRSGRRRGSARRGAASGRTGAPR